MSNKPKHQYGRELTVKQEVKIAAREKSLRGNDGLRAGTTIRHPREGGGPGGCVLDSRLRGNDEVLDSRLRGNDGVLDSRLRGNDEEGGPRSGPYGVVAGVADDALIRASKSSPSNP